jgi:hypothetical protein
VFTNQNLQALIGSDQPASVIPYDRNVMFASPYGIHTLIGVDAPKASTDIDGTWQYLDFSQTISAGQVVVENILCGAFLIKRLNDPIFGSNTIIALWFSNDGTNANTGVETSTDVWWFANFGALTFIVTGILNNVPALFGFRGNTLYQIFGDSTTSPNATAWTKLYPMEDEVQDKELIQAGVEADYFQYGTSLVLYADTDSQSLPITMMNQPTTPGQWMNSAGVTGSWQNSAGVTGGWITGGLVLLFGKPPAMHARHVGLRLVSSGYDFELHTLAIDYKLGKRWRV